MSVNQAARQVKLTIVCTHHDSSGHKDYIGRNIDDVIAQDNLPWRIGDLLRDPDFVSATIVDKSAVWHITKESVWAS